MIKLDDLRGIRVDPYLTWLKPPRKKWLSIVIIYYPPTPKDVVAHVCLLWKYESSTLCISLRYNPPIQWRDRRPGFHKTQQSDPTNFQSCLNTNKNLRNQCSPWFPAKKLQVHISGQIIIFHQPRFPWNKGSHFPSKTLPFGENRSCEVAIIWPDICKYRLKFETRVFCLVQHFNNDRLVENLEDFLSFFEARALEPKSSMGSAVVAASEKLILPPVHSWRRGPPWRLVFERNKHTTL